MTVKNLPTIRARHAAWNKGRLVGQKLPPKPKHVWAIRVRLELADRHRDLALFNMAINSKLRGCDLLHLRVTDSLSSTRKAPLHSRNCSPIRWKNTPCRVIN